MSTFHQLSVRWRRGCRPIRLIVMLLASCGTSTLLIDKARAATVQLGTSKDTTIFQSAFDNSAGGQTQFYSGTNTVASPRRGLIEFDVSQVPAGSYILSTNLTLTLSMVADGGMGGGGGTPTIALHEVASEWGEGTVKTGMGQGSGAAPGDATWRSRMHGSALWSNPGGDFAPTPSASLTIVGTKVGVPYTWLSTPALVADVQGWLGNASTNHGWLLLNTDETSSQTFRAFYSREFGTVTSRPVLEIGYAVAGDANFDDKVDGADYTLWADNFLETGTSWSDGDFNRDGTVDGADYTIWADHYGPGPALTSAVPEPSTWALLAGACLVLLPALRFEGPGKRISLVLGIRRSAIRSSIIVLLLHLSSVAAFAQDPPVPRITAAAAEKHAGQRAEIEAEIVEVKFAQRRKLHFLSASVNFRSQSNLPVAIRADDVEAFHKAGIKDFSSQYLGKKIRAQGTVIRDEDQWLLVVTAPGDIAVEKGQPAASQPDEFEVVNEQGKGVKLSLTTAELPRTSITLDHEGVQETYEGVAVSELLKRAEVTLSPEARGAQLGRYVIVTGSDGYAAVFSVAEVDPYFAERPALLVDQLNGQPVPAPRGPVRLAVPSDKHRRRWVGQVVRIEVRNALDKPTAGAESK